MMGERGCDSGGEGGTERGKRRQSHGGREGVMMVKQWNGKQRAQLEREGYIRISPKLLKDRIELAFEK